MFLCTTDDSEVVVDHVTECSISMSTDMRDITTKTSASRSSKCWRVRVIVWRAKMAS